MNRYCLYVDGFNVYHALNGPYYYKPRMPRTDSNKCFRYRKYKWLNYRKLLESIIQSKDTIEAIHYFTTFAEWRPDSVARHKEYIKALRTEKIEVTYGRFQRKQVKCHLCEQYYHTHVEKRTDVNIAVQLLVDAFEDRYDRALIISADSDLLQVIDAVHKFAPDKEVGIMFPINLSSIELRQQADFRYKMSEKLLKNSQFPNEIKVGNTVIKKPVSWC